MYRDILTNKWVLGGVGFLIVLSVACVLWYQHDTADERKAAAEAEELLRQSEIAKKATDMDSVAEQETDMVSADSTTQSAEKPTTKRGVKDTPSGETPTNLTEQRQETEIVETVRVSPHGFGTYPEVPEDYKAKHGIPVWEAAALTGHPPPPREIELMQRVLIKLWVDGDKQWTGATMGKDSKIYVRYPNQAYVRYKTRQRVDGTTSRGIARWASGGTPKPKDGKTPSGVDTIDLDSPEVGIDPYAFLGIDK